MQVKIQNLKKVKIPEHYLIWTFERKEYLQSLLHTLDNLPIEIIKLGEANQDNGPDYKNAVLKINGMVMRGDIEFHLDWRDWYQHGHDCDRRYEQVILHVLWNRPQYLPKKLHQRFSHFIISDYLSMDVEQWLEVMEAMENPSETKKNYGLSICLTKNKLEELAWRRFTRKCDQLKSLVKIHGWDDTVYIGLAKVLGYSKNSAAFFELARQLPPSKLYDKIMPLQRSPIIFWIILAWQAGLLDRPFRNSGHCPEPMAIRIVSHVYQQFIHIFPIQRQPLINWNFSRLRPNNTPYFRLAGYGQLLFHYQQRSLFKELISIIMSRQVLPSLLSKVETLLCIPLSLELRRLLQDLLNYQNVPKKVMGEERCMLFTLNILIPLLYLWAKSHGNAGFAFFLEDIFFQFPSIEDNGILREYVPTHLRKYYCKAFMQQAILEYHQQCYQQAK